MSEKPSVFEAWANVMEDVQAIGKNDRNAQQGFSFRGVDAVVDVVGPLLRKHGVIVVPSVLEESSERYASKNNAQMVNRLVKSAFTVYGPRGDSFPGSTYGEAADSGDKSISKAQSVAYRIFLLQALSIPTNQPDPDASSHERVAAPRNDPMAALRVKLAEAVDAAGVSRDDAAKWFNDQYLKSIPDGNNHELEEAIRHFSTLVNSYDEVAN